MVDGLNIYVPMKSFNVCVQFRAFSSVVGTNFLFSPFKNMLPLFLFLFLDGLTRHSLFFSRYPMLLLLQLTTNSLLLICPLHWQLPFWYPCKGTHVVTIVEDVLTVTWKPPIAPIISHLVLSLLLSASIINSR